MGWTYGRAAGENLKDCVAYLYSIGSRDHGRSLTPCEECPQGMPLRVADYRLKNKMLTLLLEHVHFPEYKEIHFVHVDFYPKDAYGYGEKEIACFDALLEGFPMVSTWSKMIEKTDIEAISDPFCKERMEKQINWLRDASARYRQYRQDKKHEHEEFCRKLQEAKAQGKTVMLSVGDDRKLEFEDFFNKDYLLVKAGNQKFRAKISDFEWTIL